MSIKFIVLEENMVYRWRDTHLEISCKCTYDYDESFQGEPF